MSIGLLAFRRPILLTLKKMTKDKSQNFNSLGDWVGLKPFPSPGAQTMEILALNVIFSREAVKRPPRKSQPDMTMASFLQLDIWPQSIGGSPLKPAAPWLAGWVYPRVGM